MSLPPYNRPSYKPPYEGLFITLEGGDGCGKSTLAASLAQALTARDYPVVRSREPGGSSLSEYIRELILRPKESLKIGPRSELLLFLAARAQHIEETILPALYAGKILLCERFHDSSIAYQGYARHLGYQEVEALCHLACGDVQPQVTLLLDQPPHVGLGRLLRKTGAQPDRLEREKLQFHEEVRQGYLRLADAYPERIMILDATQPPHLVLQQALAFLETLLAKRHVP